MITIGIDPGIYGAVAFLIDGKYKHVEDMPVMQKGSGVVKNEVNPSALVTILRENTSADEAVLVALERGQGVSSVFSLGDSFGTARASVAACRFEMEYVTPTKWKKHFNLTSDKEMCRAHAVKMFPDAELHLKKHVDRAEALLMARWAYETKF